MRSRTEGAPSLPIVSDDDVTMEQLEEARRLGVINDDQYRANLAALSGSAPAGPPPVSPATAARRERFDREVADAERGLDEMRAGPGAPPPRVRPPSPTARLEQEGQDLADSRAYGRPSQGGAPFRSAGEAEEYGRRQVASPARRAEMATQGMTDAQIIDAQRSQRDRDLAQAGRSGSSGWAPVYAEDGSVTYLERAPTQSTEPGATNTAVGDRRVGPRVDRGEVSPSLNRPDLVRRGYEPQLRHGPYGDEWVWVKTRMSNADESEMTGTPGRLASENLTNYRQEQKDARVRRGLIDRAGMTSEEAAGMSVDKIRELGSDNRAADERNRKKNNARARMAPRFRNELAFDELGGPDSNEWQNAVAAQRLSPDLRGMTPTMRDAMNMQRAFDLANAALRGGGESPLDMQREMAKEERMRQGRKLAASYMRDSPTAAGGRARAEKALAHDGYTKEERKEILDDLPFSVPAVGGGAAEPPDPLGHMM